MKKQIIIKVSDNICFVENEKDNKVISSFPVDNDNKSDLVRGIMGLLEEFNCECSVIYE